MTCYVYRETELQRGAQQLLPASTAPLLMFPRHFVLSRTATRSSRPHGTRTGDANYTTVLSDMASYAMVDMFMGLLLTNYDHDIFGSENLGDPQFYPIFMWHMWPRSLHHEICKLRRLRPDFTYIGVFRDQTSILQPLADQ